MKRILPWALCAALVSAQGWKPWAPRDEIRPQLATEGEDVLVTAGGGNPAVYGGWQSHQAGIQAGTWYRFEATFAATGLDDPAREVVARVDWTGADGKRAGQPDYPWQITSAGPWQTVRALIQAPANAKGANLQLLLVNAPRAVVKWKAVRLETAPAPERRPVSIASVNFRPQSSRDPVGEFLALMDRSLPAGTDIALLPEGITLVGTGKTYQAVAEPVPGPTTERLGEFARRKNTWVAAGVIERDGAVIYNTAVLIDRAGRLAGRYHKVYIPREEFEGGITPGRDFPVFRTDFGTVGMMICWDVQYTDPARALALNGAEMILMPIWGGDETLAKARAIENHVFLIASGYDHPTYVMDPNGERLASARVGSIASATVDLNHRYVDSWLGDMRARFMKEASGQQPPKNIVLIAADDEYRSEESMPQLARILRERHGFRTKVLYAIDPTDGTIKPDRQDNIPGIEAVDSADLVILLARFRDLPDEQMKHLVDYIESGKPIVALRTSTHAFNITHSPTYKRYSWNSKDWDGGFGRQVLGETWISHHGKHNAQSTRGVFADGAAKHPILRGIESGSIWGPSDVYTVKQPLPEGTSVLVMGQSLDGMKPDSPLSDKPALPVAWTRSYKGGRIFTTTMGASEDFLSEGFRKMIVNATHWALGMDDRITPAHDAGLVGTYEPSHFGFGTYKKGQKPPQDQ